MTDDLDNQEKLALIAVADEVVKQALPKDQRKLWGKMLNDYTRPIGEQVRPNKEECHMALLSLVAKGYLKLVEKPEVLYYLTPKGHGWWNEYLAGMKGHFGLEG